MFQIPQTAVDEFCRAAGRAGGEIPFFDQRDAQAAQRRVESQAGAGYPAADDQDVEDLFGESRKRFAPRAPGKFSRIHNLTYRFARADNAIILITRAFAVRRSFMLFFKSRFCHRATETQRGRDGGMEGRRDGRTERQGERRRNVRPVAPSPRRPVALSLFLCVSVALWLALGPFAPRLAAQEAQDKERQGKPGDIGTIRIDTDLVTVDAIVTDRDGNRISGVLKASDFAIYEDGARQTINSFSATDAPFNLVLLLDTSGSASAEVELMRRAALRFLDELRPRDRVAIIQFSKEVELLKDLTSERAEI